MKSISELNIAESMKLLLAVSILAIFLAGIAGIYCIYTQGKLINDMSNFNLAVSCNINDILNSLNKQKGFLGVSEIKNENDFKRSIKKLDVIINNLTKKFNEIGAKSGEEGKRLERLKKLFEEFKENYQSYENDALLYLENPSAEQKSLLIDKIQRLEDISKDFFENLTVLNKLMTGDGKRIARNSVIITTLFSGVGIFMMFLLGYYIVKKVRLQVGEIIGRMEDLLSGKPDLTRRIKVEGNSEIDQAAVCTNKFIEKIHHLIKALKEKTENILKEVNLLAGAFKESVSVSEVGVKQSEKILGFLENLQDEINSMASAMEEMSATINEISQNTSATSEKVKEAEVEAEKMAEVVQELKDSSKSILEMSNIIGKIADQTNLLALNASIEAARAGEAGRGFAIVANEVKELAKQTSQLVDQINTVVHEVFAKVEEVYQAGHKNKEAISTINEMAQAVATAIEEQTIVVNQLSENIVGITERAKELVKEAEDMKSLSQNILEKSEKLDIERLRNLSQVVKDLLYQFKV